MKGKFRKKMGIWVESFSYSLKWRWKEGVEDEW
jgi:hypothetical protein